MRERMRGGRGAAVCLLLMLSLLLPAGCSASGKSREARTGTGRTKQTPLLITEQAAGESAAGVAETENKAEDAASEASSTVGSGTNPAPPPGEAEYVPLIAVPNSALLQVKQGTQVREVFSEYPSFAIGTYGWNGIITPPKDHRFDALIARLNTLNAALAEGEGVRLSRITRSDTAAVSVLILTRSEEDDADGFVRYASHVWNTDTGRDLLITDVVTDEAAFYEALREAAKDGTAAAPLMRALSGTKPLDSAGDLCWTLDYDGLTVYASDPGRDAGMNACCVTLFFADHAGLFQERFLSRPSERMTEMIPGRSYRLPEGETEVLLTHEAVRHPERSPEYPVTLRIGEDEAQTVYAKQFPRHYLVNRPETDCILAEQPRYDVSYRMTVRDLRAADPGRSREYPYGFGDVVLLTPDSLLLYYDDFSAAAVNDKLGAAYGFFHIGTGGVPFPADEVLHLQGEALLASRTAETKGYRMYDEGTLAAKTLYYEKEVRPYRTDERSYIDFSDGEDVYRFTVDEWSADMLLNDICTIDEMFRFARR